MKEFDSITNLELIENGLSHIEFELDRSETSFFRVSRELHQVLYRTSIEALKGTANLFITKNEEDFKWIEYDIGDGLKRIAKESIPKCKRAWRYSKPILIGSNSPIKKQRPKKVRKKEKLIGFYTALALIQSEAFMSSYVFSSSVSISDNDMCLFEFLHEEIRNEYEHFIPKGYHSSIQSLIKLSLLCIETCLKVIDSRNILFYEGISKNILDIPTRLSEIKVELLKE